MNTFNCISYIFSFLFFSISYCNAPKNLDRLLTKVGALKFYKSGWADDAVGLDGMSLCNPVKRNEHEYH